MSDTPGFVGLPDQASLQTSGSRLSIVATLRRKTSRLVTRDIAVITANTVDNTPQPVQPRPPTSKRSWFQSVGARFHRHDHVALESSESSQEIRMELDETSPTTNSPSSPEILPSQSPVRRRHFRGRLRLHSLPARFRRRRATLFSRSSSLSDSDKENFLTMPAPRARPGMVSNAGSWSSFRSGVQRAVRGKPGSPNG
ncbi:hypothetical protein C7999DRAFT_38418 [Corynascus novoguineensis]|uniref:Uncharacterized protein n=1 Tax=Corynascus novoguineensis TaxID=1126955 RepID=A0AAN7HTC0_9PEZI|nr:hypothetical protein C7999DRAFT_38418 [Corynascus novoguineensis]